MMNAGRKHFFMSCFSNPLSTITINKEKINKSLCVCRYLNSCCSKEKKIIKSTLVVDDDAEAVFSVCLLIFQSLKNEKGKFIFVSLNWEITKVKIILILSTVFHFIILSSHRFSSTSNHKIFLCN